jgi:hypothetical protein
MVWLRTCGIVDGWLSMTDVEIEDAIREAWTILYAEPAASPVARRLVTALLAVTRGTQAHPHWITPDDLWRDRLTVPAEQNAWLAAWGPRPGEPDCRVPPALLPEIQARREDTYLLWRSTVRVSTDDDDRSRTTPKARSRHRNVAEQPAPTHPGTRRSKSPATELESGDCPDRMPPDLPDGSVRSRGSLPKAPSLDRFPGHVLRDRESRHELPALPLVVDHRAGGFMVSGASDVFGAGSAGGDSMSGPARRSTASRCRLTSCFSWSSGECATS